LVSLEVHSAPGLAIYLDKSFRGRVPPSGALVIRRLKQGRHDLLARSPHVEPINQTLSLTAGTTILELNGGASYSSPLAAQIKQALNNKDVGAAFNLYQQLVVRSPKDPQRASIEAALGAVYESIGQDAINVYVQSSGMAVRHGMFQEAAEAFRFLKIVSPNADQSIEAKLNFCEGKAKFDNNQFQEAVERLKVATQTDPRAAYAFSALGMAYRNLKKDDLALEAFKRAAELAPSWALPQLQMGYLYRDGGNMDMAKESFKNAERFDPRYPYAQEQIMYIDMLKGEYKEAERLGNEIIAKFPNSVLANLYLGQIYEESKRWAEAADAYEKGLALPSEINLEQRADYMKRLKKCRKKGK
jgi:tetratricopeptide (TPR) repeat protein